MNEANIGFPCPNEQGECHWDLYRIYDYHDDQPQETLDYWQKKQEANAAVFEPVYTKIGKTEYMIYSGYAGTEPILGKMKRLLFNDPLTKKAVPS